MATTSCEWLPIEKQMHSTSHRFYFFFSTSFRCRHSRDVRNINQNRENYQQRGFIPQYVSIEENPLFRLKNREIEKIESTTNRSIIHDVSEIRWCHRLVFFFSTMRFSRSVRVWWNIPVRSAILYYT